MGCTQQVMSCSALAILRLEISGNLLVPQAFASRVLVCFVGHEQTNAVSEICSEKLHKII